MDRSMIDDELMGDGCLISIILMYKDGNKEFELSFDETHWHAAIGNKSAHVSLGENLAYGTDESHVEFYAKGDTSTEALRELLRQIQKGSR